jgi:hypothetical protein
MIALADIATKDFSTHTEQDSSTITARLVGTADSAVRARLDAYIVALHAVARATGMSEVIVDMRELEFMNSSCLKTFVTWISNIADAGPGDHYRLRFVADAKKHWQSRSLAALACFAVDRVLVDTAA